MPRSKYDGRLAEDAECYIKRKDVLLPIKDGLLYDPSSGGSSTMLEFFHKNKSSRMVHMEYRYVLKELIKTRDDPYRVKPRKRKKRTSNASLLKTIKDLQEKVNFVTEKLTIALQPQQSPLVARERSSDKSEPPQPGQEIIAKRCPPPKIALSSDSIFSNSDEESKPIPTQKANRIQLSNKEYRSPIRSESETNLEVSEDNSQLKHIRRSSKQDSQLAHHKSTIKRHKNEASLQIDGDTLNIIGSWASRNTDFFPYKGMKRVPEGSFENDDEYFLKFLSMLNPTVRLVEHSGNGSQIDWTMPSDVMSQDEFSKKIGLVRVTSIINGNPNDPMDNSRSKPRTLRKRPNLDKNRDVYESSEKIKLPKPNTEHSHTKTIFPANRRTIDNFYEKSPKKFTHDASKKNDTPDLSTSSSEVESVDSTIAENLPSSFAKVLRKRLESRSIRKRFNLDHNSEVAQKSSEKIKLAKPNLDNLNVKINFLANGSSVNNRDVESPKKSTFDVSKMIDKLDLSTSSTDIELLELNKVEDLQSSFTRVLQKQLDLQDANIEISRQEPRSLRKRPNLNDNRKGVHEYSEKIKLSKRNTDNLHVKMNLLANNSSVNKRGMESPKKSTVDALKKTDKLYSVTSSSETESLKLNEAKNLRSSYGRVLGKRQLDSRVVKDKMKYTVDEDREIIKWVLIRDHSMKVSGNTIWMDLERKKIMPEGSRSWQSLRNRFLKIILGQLRSYGLTYDEEMKLKTGALKGSIKSKKKPIYNPNYGSVMLTQTGSKSSGKPTEPVASTCHKYDGKPNTIIRDASRYPLRAAVPRERNKELDSDSDSDTDSSDEFVSLKKMTSRKLYTNTTYVAMSDKSSV